MMELTSLLPLALITLILGLVLAVVLLFPKANKEDNEEKQHDDQKQNTTNKRNANKSSKKPVSSQTSSKKDTFTHPWLSTTLKGHSGQILDMSLSENNKYLASCSDDRSLILWTTKEFLNKDHKTIRANISYDHADMITWSPDNTAYVVHRFNDNLLEVFRLQRKNGHEVSSATSVLQFPKKHRDEEHLVGLGFASTGKFIMTCDSKTSMIIWDLKGHVLAEIDTYLMNTYCARVSTCGRFVAASGFAPDVKVWQVNFDRSNDFQNVQRAYELTGHTSGVFGFDFNGDASRVVTVSKDGFWRLFQTPTDLKRDDKCKLLHKGRIEGDILGPEMLCALGNEGLVAAFSNNNQIVFVDVNEDNDQHVASIKDVHVEGHVQRLMFDKEDKWLLTCGGKHIRVFHNVPGFKLKLRMLRSKLKEAGSQGMKEMLQEQIQRIEANLKTISA